MPSPEQKLGEAIRAYREESESSTDAVAAILSGAAVHMVGSMRTMEHALNAEEALESRGLLSELY